MLLAHRASKFYIHFMKVKIKRFDKTLPLPEYQSDGAAAMDLAARKPVIIQPHSVERVPLNIAIQPPPNHWVLMSARSSLHKKGLMLANGIGVGDADYCGDNDEYHAALYNFTNQPVKIEKGERLTQMMILSREKIEWQEQEKLESDDRGGFGSTGK